ncbi:MAG: hypothetical protein R6V46_16540 [Desulfatiglandaceae bacterium]
MKHPGEAQVAWQICKLISDLDALLWALYGDEFEKIYDTKVQEKYWESTIHTELDASYS